MCRNVGKQKPSRVKINRGITISSSHFGRQFCGGCIALRRRRFDRLRPALGTVQVSETELGRARVAAPQHLCFLNKLLTDCCSRFRCLRDAFLVFAFFFFSVGKQPLSPYGLEQFPHL